jgi:hypothetical protein
VLTPDMLFDMGDNDTARNATLYLTCTTGPVRLIRVALSKAP